MGREAQARPCLGAMFQTAPRDAEDPLLLFAGLDKCRPGLVICKADWDIIASAVLVGLLAVTYMGVSTGLIAFNKFLMSEERFPYALFLGLVHMSCSFGLNLVLLRCHPALYPSLTHPLKKVHLDAGFVVRLLLPIVGCFSAQLVLNNVAFMHSSVSFLQMMKESNVVLVYLFSLALALESFSCRRALVLLLIIGATFLTIRGEFRLSRIGLTVQGVSIVCESMKLTLQSYTLSSTGKKLDALTYVMVIAPLVFLLLAITTAALGLLWPSCPEALRIPPWQKIVEYKVLLIANGFVAFAMNVSHALFIKNSSAITFILVGIILKDVMIVLWGALFLGEPLSRLQGLGFALQLVGIVVWSLLKIFQEAPDASITTHRGPPSPSAYLDVKYHFQADSCESTQSTRTPREEEDLDDDDDEDGELHPASLLKPL